MRRILNLPRSGVRLALHRYCRFSLFGLIGLYPSVALRQGSVGGRQRSPAHVPLAPPPFGAAAPISVLARLASSTGPRAEEVIRDPRQAMEGEAAPLSESFQDMG